MAAIGERLEEVRTVQAAVAKEGVQREKAKLRVEKKRQRKKAATRHLR